MSNFTEFRDSALKVIGAVAPTIASALGGPVAGAAIQTLSKALLGKDNGSEAEIAKVLSTASPEVLAGIQKADQEFAIRMQELGLKVEELAYKDLDSARNREIQTKDKTPARLAYAVTVGFFGILLHLLVNGAPEEGGEALFIMLGSLGTAWTGIIAYYFGSSAGSKFKSEMLDKLNLRGASK